MKTAAPNPQFSKPWPTTPSEMHEAIGRRAEEIYVRNGKVPGHDMENWMQAEAAILAESAEHSAVRTAVVVRLHGIRYIGEYSLAASDGYTPGEFSPGDPVPIRFDGEKMFVKRPNGKQLETTVVRKVS